MSRVTENKTARWVPRGLIFVTTNYRMLPDADPWAQANDVARALAKAQEEAAHWGGNRHRFILMGHSAGAHLVALLAASPSLLSKYGASSPLATISLDSASLDVVQTMEQKHYRLYDTAFGKDRQFWQQTSPWHALTTQPAPFLAVCSTRRDDACPQAQHFADKVKSLGGQIEVLPQNLSHGDINQTLGLPGSYTTAVESFLSRLDSDLAARLQSH